MGISADGHLYFGVYYGEEDPRWPMGEYGRERPDEWDEEFDDWDQWLASLSGYANPYADPVVETMPERDYSDRSMTYQEREAKHERERAQWDEEHADWMAKRDAYWMAKKRLLEECPLELHYVGHYDYPMKILALTGTHLRGDFEGEEVTPEHLAKATPEKIAEAQQWCQEHGIAWEEPKWLLTGSMG